MLLVRSTKSVDNQEKYSRITNFVHNSEAPDDPSSEYYKGKLILVIQSELSRPVERRRNLTKLPHFFYWVCKHKIIVRRLTYLKFRYSPNITIDEIKNMDNCKQCFDFFVLLPKEEIRLFTRNLHKNSKTSHLQTYLKKWLSV